MTFRLPRPLASICCVLALSCDSSPRQTEFGPVSTVSAYLEGVRPVLQDLRVLNREIEDAVQSESVQIEVILPLIKEEYRPQLIQLQNRAQQLAPGTNLRPINDKLLAYLELRIRAYDLVLAGARENKPELFTAFYQTQIEADSAARVFETSLRQVQDSMR